MTNHFGKLLIQLAFNIVTLNYISYMKEASYYKILEEGIVECELCPHNCKIAQNRYGVCGVRVNRDSKLYTLNYAKPVAMNIDPIEKKPLFHFLPSSKAFSIGTVGCNLGCKHCQNWEISTARPESIDTQEVVPEKVIELAKKSGANTIAYTYNEPTIFFEYGIECSKIARENKLKNIIVSNGFINPDPLKEWCKLLDGANIDLKSFNQGFYKEVCAARLEPVLESLKILKSKKVWLEITNLIIPGLNDSFEEIRFMCEWIKGNLGREVPLHLSRFHPDYKMQSVPATPIDTLEKAKQIAEEYLDYVYIGNILSEKHENTYCPNCNHLLIQRSNFQIIENNIKEKRCIKCNYSIPGIWN